MINCFEFYWSSEIFYSGLMRATRMEIGLRLRLLELKADNTWFTLKDIRTSMTNGLHLMTISSSQTCIHTLRIHSEQDISLTKQQSRKNTKILIGNVSSTKRSWIAWTLPIIGLLRRSSTSTMRGTWWKWRILGGMPNLTSGSIRQVTVWLHCIVTQHLHKR